MYFLRFLLLLLLHSLRLARERHRVLQRVGRALLLILLVHLVQRFLLQLIKQLLPPSRFQLLHELESLLIALLAQSQILLLKSFLQLRD